MLLAIETATDVCSVALLEEGAVRAMAEVLRPRAHSEQLAPLIRDLLAREGVAAEDLGAVAVSAGPGSYTGLRIGVSTAKGLCFACGAALVSVPSLEALAWSVADVAAEGDVIVAAFHSRRTEVYAAAYERTSTELRPAAETAALAEQALADWLPEPRGDLWLVGEAASAIADVSPIGARVLDPARHRPSAAATGLLGWKKWREGTVEDLAAFEPFYLKPFEVRRRGSIYDRLPH